MTYPSMKPVIAILCAVFAIAGVREARADCGCGTELLTTTVMAGKPQLVVESNCAFGKAPAFTLVHSNGKRTPMTPSTTHRGHDRSAQYVVEPTLVAGNYTVVVSDKFDTAKLKLTVVGATSSAAPTWNGAPSVESQKQVEYGCGPDKEVNVKVGAIVPLTFVELTDNKTNTRMTGYVPVRNGTITIGHGMCGGPFSLAKNRSYIASITLVVPEHASTSTAKSLSFTYAP